MLVLSRRVGEVVMISDNVRIIVKEIRKDKVRLIIDAPPSVKIFRSELIDVDDSPPQNPRG